jgi:microsomal dipeptidase-like Zn-dependent dipeptidase
MAPEIVVDGHTHIVNRMYWEHIDPWQPQPFGFDFARAFASGVNVIVENVARVASGDTVAKVAGQNWMRVFDAVLTTNAKHRG